MKLQIITYFFLVSLLIVPAGAQSAIEAPEIKPGFWHITDLAQNKYVKSCFEADTPQKAINSYFETLGSLCTEMNVKKRSDTSYESNLICNIAGVSWNVFSLIEGDFQNQYFVRAVSKMTPALLPELNKELKLRGDYKGECPKDIKPGEMLFPDGRKVEIESAIVEIPKSIIQSINLKLKEASRDFLKNLSQSLQR